MRYQFKDIHEDDINYFVDALYQEVKDRIPEPIEFEKALDQAFRSVDLQGQTMVDSHCDFAYFHKKETQT
jgi:hypothetical protein